MFRYGPSDPSTSHGGFNSVSISQTAMNVTFYDTSGEDCEISAAQLLSISWFLLSGKKIYNTTLAPIRNWIVSKSYVSLYCLFGMVKVFFCRKKIVQILIQLCYINFIIVNFSNFIIVNFSLACVLALRWPRPHMITNTSQTLMQVRFSSDF